MKEGKHEEKVKKEDGMSTIIVNLIINNNTVAILLVSVMWNFAGNEFARLIGFRRNVMKTQQLN